MTNLDLYYTSAATNLARAVSFAVSNSTFSATIPADCVFTLTSPPSLPSLSPRREGANLLLSWPTNFTGFVPEYTTSPPTPNWLALTGAPAVVNDQFTITSTISATREFYRLRQP